MAMSHANCSHDKTKAARSACRKANGSGTTVVPVSDATMAKAKRTKRQAKPATAVNPDRDPTLVWADMYQAAPEAREVNERSQDPSRHIDSCFLCGRGLTEKARNNGASIHLHVDGYLIENTEANAGIDENSGSQGFFSIGSECAKRLPLEVLCFDMTAGDDDVAEFEITDDMLEV